LSELTPKSTGTDNVPEAANAATVEIAGRSFRADITELILRDCGLTNSDIAGLSQFTNLERLDISAMPSQISVWLPV
jgi:hypothetical protein